MEIAHLVMYVCVMMVSAYLNVIYARKDPIARMLHQKYYVQLESTEIEQGKRLATTVSLGKSHCKTVVQNAIYVQKDPIAQTLHPIYYVLLGNIRIIWGKPLAWTALLVDTISAR